MFLAYNPEFKKTAIQCQYAINPTVCFGMFIKYYKPTLPWRVPKKGRNIPYVWLMEVSKPIRASYHPTKVTAVSL